jgi:orotidine-5'-phosphate decarboxylase
MGSSTAYPPVTQGVDARDRLIVPLDVPTLDEARSVAKGLYGLVRTFKIGMILQFLPGVDDLIKELVDDGQRVFLDAKCYDIPATIQGAVERVAGLGVKFLTVHGNSDIVRAAVRGCQGTDLKILSITVLTSLDQQDLQEMGFTCTVEELVLHRTRKALQYGCHGVITSGHEAQAIREAVGNQLLIVTPGIRFDGAPIEDQKRVMKPAQAIQAGADYLVIGRSILRHSAGQERREVTTAILDEMQEAFDAAAR